MALKPDAGPAYPLVWQSNVKEGGSIETTYAATGLTVRDHFAAAALQGFLGTTNAGIPVDPEKLAAASFMIADAMIRERQG
jgi:hypothetical protein